MLRTCLIATLLAGCGDNQVAVDAAIMVDAKTTIELETVYQNNTPAPDVDVVFGDATGEVVSTTQTDTTGKLTIDLATMPTVTMVTVMAMDSGNVELETIMGIEPGDVLAFSVPGGPPTPSSTTIATLDATFPPNPPATTNSWKFDALCASTTVASAIAITSYTINSGCQGSDTMLAIVATASHDTTPLAFSTTTVQVAASGDTTVTFPAWRTDFTTFQQSYTNAPTGTVSTQPQLDLLVNGDRWSPTNNPKITGAADLVESYAYPTGFAMGGSYGIAVSFGTMSLGPVSLWQQITATIPTSDARDLSATLFPQITSTGVAATTTARPKVVWSAVGPMTNATSGFASISWSTGYWFMIFPPRTASPVEVPALPDLLAAYRPPTDGSVSSVPTVAFQTDSYDADYNAARQNHPTIPATYEWYLTENPY